MNIEDRVQSSPDGYKWFVGGSDTDDHLALGGHEVGLASILYTFADEEKSYLNVGAHVGTWAIRMAEHFKEVWAVECNPLTANRLHANVALNKLENVEIVNKAFWDADNLIVSLVDAQGKSTGGSTRAQYGPGAMLAQTATVDEYFSYPYRPTFGLISLDVEGAEARVIRGAVNTIRKDRPFIIVELHEGHPGTDADLRQQVYNLLDSLDYLYFSTDIAGEEMLICVPNTLAEPETVKADLPTIATDGIVPSVHTRNGELIYG